MNIVARRIFNGKALFLRLILSLSMAAFLLPYSLLFVGTASAGSTYTFLTQWGSLGTGNGQFKYPWAIATDSTGNVYVADTQNNRIQEFSNDGTFVTTWGSIGSGNGNLNSPKGIAVSAANFVYVSDSANNRVEVFFGNGTYALQWGGTGSGDGLFTYPWGIAVDSAYNVYVVDVGNNRVQKFNSTGTFVAKWGSIGSSDGQFNHPSYIAVDSTYVYVTDAGNSRIQKFDKSGNFIAKWGTAGSANGQLNNPNGIAVEPVSGNIFVADTNNNRVQEFTNTGSWVTKWGGLGTGIGQFDFPSGVACDSNARLFVVDTDNNRIQKFGFYGDTSMSYTGSSTASTTSYLPVMLNNAYGGWTSGANIFNTAGSPANVTIKYYNSGGTLVNTQTNTIPAHGYWGVSQNAAGLYDGFAGSAIVTSGQNVAVVVNETSATSSMSYEGLSVAQNTVYTPVIMNNVYGGWTTGVNIMNASPSSNTVTINYYNSGGGLAYTQSNTLAPYAYWGVSNASGVSNGFAGDAVISGGQPIAVVVNETNSSNGGSMSYSGFNPQSIASTVKLPVMLNNAYGGWTTGVNIMNTSAVSSNVTVYYYNASGVSFGSQTSTIPPYGYWGISQASAGLPDGFIGSGYIVSVGGWTVAVVNQTKIDGNAMGYDGLGMVGATVNLPVVMNNAYGGWTTGININNPNSSAVNVTITFYDSSGATIGSASNTVVAHGYWGANQAFGPLANGQAGSAVITSSAAVAVVVNETKW